jgi:hypothetical protein
MSQSEDRHFKLRPWQAGDEFSAAHWQEPVDALNRLLEQRAEGGQLGPNGRERLILEQFRLVRIETDVLICHPFNGSEETEVEVSVAMPFLLRRTPFDGNTRDGITYTYTSDTERTASDGSDSEKQLIIPTYTIESAADGYDGDLIYAHRSVRGGVDLDDADGEPFSYIDANLDGRAWARKFDQS